MRYIKLFEELFQEGPQHLQDKISGALVELEDLGFQVDKIFSLSDDNMKGQEVAVRIQKDVPFKYSEVKEVVSIFIEYVEEIWGYVNVKWRCYGYPDPDEKMKPKSFNNEPTDDTYLYDLEIRLKNHN
jgi:hypothetical protein